MPITIKDMIKMLKKFPQDAWLELHLNGSEVDFSYPTLDDSNPEDKICTMHVITNE
jgi:hypothetical protein